MKKAVAKAAKKIEKKEGKGKPGKQRGLGSTVARGALKGASSVANAVLPGSGSLLGVLGKSALNALGLSEKTVLPGDYGGGDQEKGGSIVASADAPVAFGRMDAPTSFARTIHTAKNGDKVMHLKEAFTDVTTNAVLNTRSTTVYLVYPTSTQFVISRQYAANFQLYRILAAKVHYVHWAPTSTQARVCTWYVESPAFNDGTAPTFLQSSQLEDFATGSAYEDWALEFFPEGSLNWYECYQNLQSGTPSGDRAVQYQGQIGFSVDLNNVTSATVGTLFIEWVIAFAKQRPPDILVGVMMNIDQYLVNPAVKGAIVTQVEMAKQCKDASRRGAALDWVMHTEANVLLTALKSNFAGTPLEASLLVNPPGTPLASAVRDPRCLPGDVATGY